MQRARDHHCLPDQVRRRQLHHLHRLLHGRLQPALDRQRRHLDLRPLRRPERRLHALHLRPVRQERHLLQRLRQPRHWRSVLWAVLLQHRPCRRHCRGRVQRVQHALHRRLQPDLRWRLRQLGLHRGVSASALSSAANYLQYCNIYSFTDPWCRTQLAGTMHFCTVQPVLTAATHLAAGAIFLFLARESTRSVSPLPLQLVERTGGHTHFFSTAAGPPSS